MRLATITLKNYRCFADTHPAAFEIGKGFTALVGTNNSGKSSFLKFLYEFQGLWTHLRDPNIRQRWVVKKDDWIALGLREVTDTADIVCDVTRRPLQVTVDFPVDASDARTLSRVVVSTPTGQPSVVGAEFFFGPQNRPVRASDNGVLVDNSSTPPLPIDCTRLDQLCEDLTGVAYVGPFRNAINQGTGDYYSLKVGTSFVAMWNGWQTGISRANRLTIRRITDDIAHIFRYRRLDIHASEDRTTLLLEADGRPYQLRDMGSGLAQFVILFGNVAITNPTVLLIDEPELNLHPSLQIDFLTSLASYTKRQTVIFATHSMGLARSSAERIALLHRPIDASVVTPYERTPNLTEFLGEMSFSTAPELGYDTILLVEGTSEVKAIQQFLRLLGKDHRIVLIPLGGSGMIRDDIEHELRELMRLSSKVAALIDSERSAAGVALTRERQDFLDTCARLDIAAHATELRAFENYLPAAAIQVVNGPNFRALRPYERLADVPQGWSKSDNWRIAREMTEAELLATDVGQFLTAL